MPWVLSNRNPDGGFVFARDLYWPSLPVMDTGGPNRSEMDSPWFRTLCLAIMGQVLLDTLMGRVPWRFCDCPGFSFWCPELTTRKA